MKVQIYEADVFFNFLDFDTDYIEEESLIEVPDQLVDEYLEALKAFKEVSRKIGAIKESNK